MLGSAPEVFPSLATLVDPQSGIRAATNALGPFDKVMGHKSGELQQAACFSVPESLLEVPHVDSWLEIVFVNTDDAAHEPISPLRLVVGSRPGQSFPPSRLCARRIRGSPNPMADTAHLSGAPQAIPYPKIRDTADTPGETPATWAPSAAGLSSRAGDPTVPGDASRARVRWCPDASGSPRVVAAPRRSVARASSLRGRRPLYLLAARSGRRRDGMTFSRPFVPARLVLMRRVRDTRINRRLVSPEW